MRQSLWSVFFLVAVAGCGPSAGAPCTSSDAETCKSSKEMYACIGGKWAVAPCDGPMGCVDSVSFSCDVRVATANTPCPNWAVGRVACQQVPSALVNCVSGQWQQATACNSCSIANGAPECQQSGTGGGGGTGGGSGGGSTGGGSGGGSTGGGGPTGGGGATATCNASNCTGCCSNGQCIPPPINGSTNFCGRNGGACIDCGATGARCDNATFTCVASTSCNQATCPNGCCTNGQCFNAPLNSTTNFCGTRGNACSDCGRLGLICTAATFTCNPPNTGGGGGTTGGGGGTSDPCQGVPVGGECVSASLVRFCSVPTGTGTASVQTFPCSGGSVCQATGAGAACVQTGTCRQNDTRCTSPTMIQQCNSNGTWAAAQTCGGAGCVGSGLGANCAIALPTNTISATLRYEKRTPLPSLTDWGAPSPSPARNVVVLSVRGQEWIDATTTNANGQFTLKVPTSPTSSDAVIFAALGGDGLGVRYMIADPGLGVGTFSPGQQGPNGRTWSWSKAASSISDGSITTITTAEGSGALALFDVVQSVWGSSVVSNQGQQGMTLSVWLGIGTEWSCGACFSDSGGDFETSIWMPGGAQDQGYWSDYTTAHELGHWQMRSYGTAPAEGGSHVLSCPTFPGQAWSEGYATWHSAAVRNQPRLEDKQGGGFFWFDISSRTYYPGSNAPEAITGPGGTDLLAQIDENAVASMLWYISNSRQTGSREIFNAVASTHMNTTPWPRGYTRHTWDVGANCSKVNVVNTNQPSLHVADMLDALSCGGSPAQSNRVPAFTLQQTCSAPTSSGNGAYYPYPSASPVCRAGFCYGCRTGTSTCNPGNVATACGTGGVQCVQCASGQSCVNGVCL